MREQLRALAVVLLAFWAVTARAELTIEITQGRDNAVPVAVVPFLWSGPRLPEDVASIVEQDLGRSGQFAPLERASMLAYPVAATEVVFSDWRRQQVEYLLIGQVARESDGRYRIDYELFDTQRERSLLKAHVTGVEPQLRDLAHHIADQVYQKLTGVKGAFSTKIMYVSAHFRSPERTDYTLFYADADGRRPRPLLRSKEPILSPSWSPDGKRVAYVSFEGGRPGVYLQELASGKREKLTRFPGINGAPRWSPDGRQLALVLSRHGNPDIYLLDLATRKLTQVTDHYGIDTEPSWMPDGKSLVFTSNRAGGPQIYQLELASGAIKRLTFEGRYNASAQLFNDGKAMVLVHKGEGVDQFNIALLNLENQRLRLLTSTRLDESPTIAPNGAMVLYATKHQGRGVLAGVSSDGRVQFRLPAEAGDVREPAWSPYLN